jgi:hypothetical protein
MFMLADCTIEMLQYVAEKLPSCSIYCWKHLPVFTFFCIVLHLIFN